MLSGHGCASFLVRPSTGSGTGGCSRALRQAELGRPRDCLAQAWPDVRKRRKPPGVRGLSVVGDTGIEPVTSSVSGKRATAAPIARVACVDTTPGCCWWNCVAEVRWRRDSNPCGRLCRPLPSLSATPPCVTEHTAEWGSCWNNTTDTRADDEIRTRDPHLGKVMRYHCATSALPASLRARMTLAETGTDVQTGARTGSTALRMCVRPPPSASIVTRGCSAPLRCGRPAGDWRSW
jgi:hypothetical protein